jgi:hypothetical protein
MPPLDDPLHLVEETDGPAGHTTRLASSVEEELGAVVSFDWLCVGITDPLTGLVTMVQSCEPIGPPEAYLATEMFVRDYNKIAWLGGQSDPVGVLSEATGGDLSRSYRYRHALEPSGIRHELRAALVVDGMCWGYLVLLRGPERPDFTPAEAQEVRSAIPRLATALRARLLARSTERTEQAEPGIAIIRGDGSLEAANTPAQVMFEQISGPQPAAPVPTLLPTVRGDTSSRDVHARLRIVHRRM